LKKNYSIRNWLGKGWQDFRTTMAVSIAFSGIFMLIGMASIWTLTAKGYALLAYPFIGGFLVVAPILLTGYQRAGRLLAEGQKPRFKDLALGVTEATPGIWFLTFVLCVCYLIWVTDALVLYGIYFDFHLVALDSSILSDAEQRGSLLSYLLFSGVMGLFIALMSFTVAVFSIPLIMHRKMHFVAAVHSSVVTVFRHFGLMMRWALTISLLNLITLVVALPLLVVVLPVVAYASYAAFVDLYPEEAAVE
jgi:uncharacterized membrane protein